MWEEEQPFFCINGALHKYAMVDFTNISWFTNSTFWNSLSLDADRMNSAKNTSWTSTYVSRWKSILNSLADQVSQVCSYCLSTRSLISFFVSVGFYKVGKLRANMEVIVWFNLCYLDMKINICIMYSRRLYLVDSGLVLIPSLFIFSNISHLSIKRTRWTVLDTGTEC